MSKFKVSIYEKGKAPRVFKTEDRTRGEALLSAEMLAECFPGARVTVERIDWQALSIWGAEVRP